MKILFYISLIISLTICEKKLLKVRECFTDPKISRLVRCEIIDGTFFLTFDVLSPVPECMFEICFYISENSKFRLLGKCQQLNRCAIDKSNVKFASPMITGIMKFWKRAGIMAASTKCPLFGLQEYSNITLSSNFFMFLPKGILLFTVRIYNDEFENIVKIANVLVNKSRLERCEVVDGKCFLKFEVLKPIEQCMVELCFYKSENTKFRLLGRCQHIDRCEMFKPAYANNPFTKSIVAFWKRSGISAASGPCPLQGVQNYKNITMNENFLVFLPKGILLFTFKLYNDEFDNIIKMGMIIINN
ncbi:unnamed protein product [Chironomus riparius]|uniref:Uncharacterized protein n=1 Tax=Chironomus riparius TaxID=315576 RepID=A0A9N9S592_9DIPT|nr:unnamed protein product [Chironomus riparius]